MSEKLENKHGGSVNVQPLVIREKWDDLAKVKPESGSACFIANEKGDDYLVGIYYRDKDGFEHINPIGGGSPEFEWDFYDYKYWIEFDIELPNV